jgi:hypothetical protein
MIGHQAVGGAEVDADDSLGLCCQSQSEKSHDSCLRSRRRARSTAGPLRAPDCGCSGGGSEACGSVRAPRASPARVVMRRKSGGEFRSICASMSWNRAGFVQLRSPRNHRRTSVLIQRHVQLEDLFEQLGRDVAPSAARRCRSRLLQHVLGPLHRIAQHAVAVVEDRGGFERVAALALPCSPRSPP